MRARGEGHGALKHWLRHCDWPNLSRFRSLALCHSLRRSVTHSSTHGREQCRPSKLPAPSIVHPASSISTRQSTKDSSDCAGIDSARHDVAAATTVFAGKFGDSAISWQSAKVSWADRHEEGPISLLSHSQVAQMNHLVGSFCAAISPVRTKNRHRHSTDQKTRLHYEILESRYLLAGDLLPSIVGQSLIDLTEDGISPDGRTFSGSQHSSFCGQR